MTEMLEGSSESLESEFSHISTQTTPPKKQHRKWLLAAVLAGVVLTSGGLAYAYYGPGYENPVRLRAGVIKGSGEVHPAARDWFIAMPYSLKDLRSKLKTLNKIGAPPLPPKQEDSKFNPKQTIAEKPEDPDSVYASYASLYPLPEISEERFKTNCIDFEFSGERACFTDYDAYQSARDRWEQSRTATYQAAKNRMAAWEKQKAQWENEKVKAYQQAYNKYLKEYHAWIEKGETSLDQAVSEQMLNRHPVRAQADLDGRAELRLKPGKWYLSGGNVTGFSSLFWQEVPLEVGRQSQTLELANDQGETGDSKEFGEKEPDVFDELLSHQEKAKELSEALRNPALIHRALARHYKVDAQNLDGWSLLHAVAAAAPVPERAELTHLLLVYGADLNLADKNGRTPLHLAIERNNRTSTMLLLAHGASTAKVDTEIRTPLHLAVEKNRPEHVKLLLRYQASLTAVDKKGRSPLQLAQELKKTDLIKLLEAAAPKRS